MSAGTPVYVHPAALVESERIGAGTRVWAFAHVMPGASIGVDCNVCGHVFVEDGAVVGDRVTLKNNVLLWRGVVIEDDVFVGPGVVFTNDRSPRAHVRKTFDQLLPTHVQRGATLGANATVVCGLRIGEEAFVAAGAVVTRDVPSNALVAGNPARQLGWACRCGSRLRDDLSCECGMRYEHGTDRLRPAPAPPP